MRDSIRMFERREWSGRNAIHDGPEFELRNIMLRRYLRQDRRHRYSLTLKIWRRPLARGGRKCAAAGRFERELHASTDRKPRLQFDLTLDHRDRFPGVHRPDCADVLADCRALGESEACLSASKSPQPGRPEAVSTVDRANGAAFEVGVGLAVSATKMARQTADLGP